MSDRPKVDCYSGFRGEESPRAVRRGAGRELITEILEQWIEAGPEPGGPALRCFQVRLESGRVMELALDEATGEWTVRQA